MVGVTLYLFVFQTKKYADIIIPRGSENKGRILMDLTHIHLYYLLSLLQLLSM